MRTPARTAERKAESRHNQWWYPSRCEKPGCENQDNLLRCGACKTVQYCCPEHQRDDWPIHKEECKVFQRLGIRATFYKDADMLEKYPLQTPSRRRATLPVPEGSSCTLCLMPDREVGMTRTRCCGQPICDTSDNYVLMSYSREFCERSHDRYTLCGYHGVERACDKTKDWRECPECTIRTEPTRIPDMLWRGLNPYNFCPLLSRSVPRHSLCERCGRCNKLFISGMEGASFGVDGFTCLRCGPVPRP